MFCGGHSETKQRSRSALCDELSLSESHFQSAKSDGRRARGVGRRGRKRAQWKRRRGTDEATEGGDLNETPPFCSSAAHLQP